MFFLVQYSALLDNWHVLFRCLGVGSVKFNDHDRNNFDEISSEWFFSNIKVKGTMSLMAYISQGDSKP